MKVRHKERGTVAWSGTFNTHGLGEIIVTFDDGSADSDYQRNWEAQLKDGRWVDIGEGLRSHDIIVDNHNTRFFEPRTADDRERGFTTWP